MRIANLTFSNDRKERRGRGRSRKEPRLLHVQSDPELKPSPEEANRCLAGRSGVCKIEVDPQKLLGLFVRPRTLADLIFNLDWDGGQSDVRRSVVHDVEPQVIYLSQTDPPVMPSLKGQSMQVTFFEQVREGNHRNWCRAGYQTELVDVIRPYEFADFTTDSLLVFKRPKKLTLTSTRTSPRLCPTKDMVIDLHLLPYFYPPLKLADISTSGVSFHHNSTLEFMPDQCITLRLLSGLTTLYLDAKVVHSTNLGFYKTLTAAYFLEMDLHTYNLLRILITQMTRHLLALRSGINPSDIYF